MTDLYCHWLKTWLRWRLGRSRCVSCGARGKLEFAHLRPTGLRGMGRGSKHRLLDIKRNLMDYTLLCFFCHRDFDRGLAIGHQAAYGNPVTQSPGSTVIP